ncbi:MAG: preprotein translocase subunit SecE [Firmicutes bacterium]|nr:preprotein translocase subunit SecE [Bacillota bacterium]
MANTKDAKKKSGGIKAYFRGIKSELKKVIWPTKKELISYTGVVLLTCAICAVGFWAIDSVCAVILQKLLGITISM